MFWPWLATTGTSSDGIYAQSIGGGGGVGGASSFSASIGPASGKLQIGASGAGGGDGGQVEATNAATGSISTEGVTSNGITAESVGGGGGKGGITGASMGALKDLSVTLGGSGGPGGDGASVTVNDYGAITTSGRHSYGILAQSTGGGGGIAHVLSKDRSTDDSAPDDISVAIGIGGNGGGGGTGGPVTVNVGQSAGSLVSTTGTGGIGIVAQSEGGGVISSPDGKGYAFSGTSPYTDCSGSACTGSVTVELGSNTVTRASGPDSYAIFVQSRGNGLNSTTVNVGSGAFVESWAKSAGAIYVGGDASTGRNLIIVQSGGTIDDGTGSNVPGNPTPNATGVAITGSAPFLVLNSGTINGSFVSPKGLASSIDNRRRGKLNAGTIVDLGPGGLLKNSGTMDLGGSGQIATTTLHGDFVQTRKGQLRIDADHANAVADQLIVSGDVELAGKIRINPLTLGSTSLTVLQSGGTLTPDPNAKLIGTRLIHYTPTLTGQTLQVTPTVNFRGMDRDLDRGQRSVAAALQQMWEGSGAEPLASAASPTETDSGTGSGMSAESAFSQGLAAIAASPDSSSFQKTLNELSGQPVLGIAPSLVSTSQDFVASMNSCPAFAGTGTLLVEGDCAWGRMTGGFIDRSGDSSTIGYDVKSLTTQLGGQKEVAPDWFLGGSVAYQLSKLDGDDNSAEVDGNGLMAGAILKRQIGQLLLSGAVNAGYGWYDSSRNIDVAAGQSQAKGSPDAINGGLHARAAYELPRDAWYLRPTLSLDANYVRVDGYDEHGGSPFNLNVDSSDKVILSATPALEVGGRIDLASSVLRPFGSVGVSLFGPNNWKTDARFDNSASGSFTTELANPNVVGRLSLGVDMATVGSLDIRLQYDLEAGDNYTSNSGTLRLAYRL